MAICASLFCLDAFSDRRERIEGEIPRKPYAAQPVPDRLALFGEFIVHFVTEEGCRVPHVLLADQPGVEICYVSRVRHALVIMMVVYENAVYAFRKARQDVLFGIYGQIQHDEFVGLGIQHHFSFGVEVV